MAALRQNTAEGGTDAVVVTTGNSGGVSGDAWQAVNGGTVWTYSAAHTARGALAYKCDQAAGVAAVLQWQLATVTEHYGRLYFYVTDFAASADPFVRAYATGFSEGFRIELNAAHRLVVRDANAAACYTGTTVLTAGTWYRLEWHVVASTTVGQLEAKLFVADSATPFENFTSAASLNVRAETSWVQIGPSFALNPAPQSKWFDEIVIGAAADGWIGIAAGTPINQAPTVTAGPDDEAEPRAVYTLQASASDDGTIASWQWRQISGTPVALSSNTVQYPTFTVPAVQGGDVLVFGVTVTDNGGLASAEDTVTITARTPTLFFARGGSWQP